jgi:mannose-1-phosphate guanylyltransferase / mannose-6-phosphate isomerase
LHACGCAPSAVFIEPEGRNTAPAFEQAVAAAVGAAHAGWLSTFGVTPSTPETGYGYIQARLAIGQLAGVQHVDGFVEKPDLAAARQLIQSAACFWNSGMFVFSVKAYLTELALWQPDVLTAVTLAWVGTISTQALFTPSQRHGLLAWLFPSTMP